MLFIALTRLTLVALYLPAYACIPRARSHLRLAVCT